MKLRTGIATGIMAVIGLLAGCGAVDSQQYNLEQYEQAVQALQVGEPTGRAPLQMTTSLVPATAAPGETVRLVIKVKLMPGWHFYEYVPEGEPYKQTEWLMELGEGLQSLSEWEGPSAEPYLYNPMMAVYEGGEEAIVFYRELVVNDDASGELTVKAGLYFQTCDANMCLPTRKQMDDLVLKVTGR